MVGDAIDVARRYALRAPDAIHLASAERARGVVADFVFVASDRELLTAAEASAMKVLNPEADGAIEYLRELRVALAGDVTWTAA